MHAQCLHARGHALSAAKDCDIASALPPTLGETMRRLRWILVPFAFVTMQACGGTQSTPDEAQNVSHADAAGAESPEDTAETLWCTAPLREDRGQHQGVRRDDAPCMVTTAASADGPPIDRDYFSYYPDGKVRYSWRCDGDGDGCAVQEFLYGDVLDRRSFVVEARTCTPRGDGERRLYDYALRRKDASGQDATQVIQTITLITPDGEERPGSRVTFDRWGNIVEIAEWSDAENVYSVSRRYEYDYADEGKILARKAYFAGEPAYYDTYHYDENDRLVRIEAFYTNEFDEVVRGAESSATEADAELTIAYDDRGRVLSKTAVANTEQGKARGFIRGGYNAFFYECASASTDD